MFELEVSKQMNYIPWKHSPITKTINLVKGGTTVLDIGCSYGYVGKELKKKNCTIYGIEIDEEMGKIAEKEYEKVVICDISNTQSLPFKNEFFDYIISLDVLEHLARPDSVLKKLKPYLKKTGFLIVSLPNIARWEVRLQLLFGNFKYCDTGILSKGHLRFFTKKTACQLIEESGFKISDIQYTGLASMIKILPNLTTYQFLITGSV